jgi:subtilase family serine protease
MSRRLVRVAPVVIVAAAAVLWLLAAATISHGRPAGPAAPMPRALPFVTQYAQVSTSETPPTPQQCYAAATPRRCFSPQALYAAYNITPLHDAGLTGKGRTIAVVDSYGSDTMAHDLHVFNNAWGLQHMCGEEGVTCQSGMPKFSELSLQGSPATKAPPSKSQGTGQEDKSAWALEVALDVEMAHAMAPGANILLVHTPTAETLGVQGLPQMMAAEKYVVEHHHADVISQSFGTAEGAVGRKQSRLNQRAAFKEADANGVTIVASTGDDGSANDKKTPVGQGGTTLSGATVGWPASDPLVTAVGGTSLCTSAEVGADAGRVADNVNPPAVCQSTKQDEVAWGNLTREIGTGGGFSDVFARPSWQSVLPAGSTPIPADRRGIPDISMHADPFTGALVYVSLPPDGLSGTSCGDNPCSTGWYDIGGTSLSSPEWAGLVAIAAQIKGHGLGLINDDLYGLAADPGTYAKDFHDITEGTNAVNPDVPGYNAGPGWDPTTGLGTPNAANLIPDLAAASS